MELHKALPSHHRVVTTEAVLFNVNNSGFTSCKDDLYTSTTKRIHSIARLYLATSYRRFADEVITILTRYQAEGVSEKYTPVRYKFGEKKFAENLGTI